MTKRSPSRYFKTSPEIIRLAVMMYVRFPSWLGNMEDLLHERDIDTNHKTNRIWWNKYGPLFSAEIRKKRVSQMRAYSNWQQYLDEVFVEINGETIIFGGLWIMNGKSRNASPKSSVVAKQPSNYLGKI